MPTLKFLPFFYSWTVFTVIAVNPILQLLIQIETLKRMVKPFSSEHQYKLYWLGYLVASKLRLVNLSQKEINQKGVRSLRSLTGRPGNRLAKRTARTCYRNTLWAVLLVVFPRLVGFSTPSRSQRKCKTCALCHFLKIQILYQKSLINLT